MTEQNEHEVKSPIEASSAVKTSFEVPEGMVLVDKAALGQVLTALVGNSYQIRELQATMIPYELFKDNPINILIDGYKLSM